MTEIMARMREANAERAFEMRQLEEAAKERLALSAEEGNINNAADEIEIDLNEGVIGDEGKESPNEGGPELTAEQKTYGMTHEQAVFVEKFAGDVHRVKDAIAGLKGAGADYDIWWNHTSMEISQGKFLEAREAIFKMIEGFSNPWPSEEQFIEALQQVSNRI